MEGDVLGSVVLIEPARQLFGRPEEPPQGPSQVYALSLWKCLSNRYLAQSLSAEAALACYLHHYRFLLDSLSLDSFAKLTSADVTLWRHGAYLITVKMEHVIPNEGELTLHFKEGGAPLYGLSFSFVPGQVFGRAEPSSILIGRMQGRAGEVARIAEATRACGEITPQACLYRALAGIAMANSLGHMLGVSAANHVCYEEARAGVFEQAYDAFYASLKAEPQIPGFVDLPIQPGRRPLSEVVGCHRRRTRRKRAAKLRLSEQVCAEWSQIMKC
jgi:uncharacterized protein VirK/YbjX